MNEPTAMPAMAPLEIEPPFALLSLRLELVPCLGVVEVGVGRSEDL